MKPHDPTVNDAAEVGSYAWAEAQARSADAALVEPIDENEATLAGLPMPAPEPDVLAPGPGQLDIFGGEA